MCKKQFKMAKKATPTKKIDANSIIENYMNYVLEEEQFPQSVFKFTSKYSIQESDFYNHFGSFDGIQQEIWYQFFAQAHQLMSKSKEYTSFTDREKLLTMYYTLFEMFTANRSYILFALKEQKSQLKSLKQLTKLRSSIKDFATDLVQKKNEEQHSKLFKQSEPVIAEATWVQFLFLLKFWLDDSSAGFEKTDVAIEKSVNTVFDLLNTKPLESLIDFGKFLWKEKMM